MRLRPHRPLWTAALALAVLPAHAGVYKWVDAKGQTHYDDRSVSGQLVTREVINQRVIAAAPDWASAAVPADYAQQVGARCAELGARLESYRSAQQLFGRDPDGQVYAMSSMQAGLAIAEARRDARLYCAPDAARELYAEGRTP